ncbi:MAG: RidA family protein [Phycisphaerales bacterium JB063]
MDINQKLAGLGLTLPPAAKPVATYVPSVESGGHLFLSGQLPMKDGQLAATGPVGSADGPDLAAAQQAAQQCALNAIAQIDAALKGDWSRLRRFVRLGVFVAAGPEFTEHHLVANGASELIGKIFGSRGEHARSAVGVPSLPLGASVEVDFVIALD